jgi:hypothetical protein
MKAFPSISFDSVGQITTLVEGMDLRDYFAAKALQALVSIPDINMSREEFANCAYEYANAMMEARNVK